MCPGPGSPSPHCIGRRDRRNTDVSSPGLPCRSRRRPEGRRARTGCYETARGLRVSRGTPRLARSRTLGTDRSDPHSHGRYTRHFESSNRVSRRGRFTSDTETRGAPRRSGTPYSRSGLCKRRPEVRRRETCCTTNIGARGHRAPRVNGTDTRHCSRRRSRLST